MADFNTLEEARAEIIRLQEENTRLTNERDTLSQNNTTQAQELDSVRRLNQEYFNKLSQQFIPTPDKNDNDEEEVPTCEDFAKTLNII